VGANVTNVPYWLNMDRGGVEAMHAAVERFKVGRCRLTLSKFSFKPPGTKRLKL
jgi:hypothetical protein